MKKSMIAFIPLFTGLLISQAFATLFVFNSNSDLQQRVYEIIAGGYLAVPNLHIAQGLNRFSSAFFGGLFFTLSSFGVPAVISFIFAWFWRHHLNRGPYILTICIVLWSTLLIMINLHGFLPIVSVCFITVPLVVSLAAHKCIPRRSGLSNWRGLRIHLLTFVLLAVLFFTQFNTATFLNIRDHFLWSNVPGEKITAFYYRYNLLAAERFKSQKQKTVHTCRLAGIDDGLLREKLQQKLLHYDYLILDGSSPVDLEIRQIGDDMALAHRNRIVMKVSTAYFLENPRAVLKDYSQKQDIYTSFRKFTFICLLLMLAGACYLGLYIPSLFISSRFLRSKVHIWRSLFAGLLTIMLASLFLFQANSDSEKITGSAEIEKRLYSPDRRQRITGIKAAIKTGMDISRFKEAAKKMQVSTSIPERYWYVKALSLSSRKEVFSQLLAFLDDPNLNVACMAYAAMGQAIHPDQKQKAIEEILCRLKNSESWYEQIYAYRALKHLGWKQKISG